MNNVAWSPVTHENCSEVKGPFYHGSKQELGIGELLVAGCESNFERGRISNNVYFSALLEPAVWGAELSTALSGAQTRGFIYIVEPTGRFEDDPNLTNKRFAGNPTQSYRTGQPLKIVGRVKDWVGHPPEVLQKMVDNVKERMRAGSAAIED